MKRKKTARKSTYRLPRLAKCPTGVSGLDEVTEGGLPRERASLLTGSAGSGKTILSLEFLTHGALEHGEAGLYLSFEETEAELITNFSSVNCQLIDLVKQKKIIFDHISMDQSAYDEAGEYKLEGLFIRIAHVLKQYKIKRLVIDSIDYLFSHFANQSTIRTELQRLFEWLKMKKVTTIVVSEKGENTITRHGIEEYVADCVIFLDNRVIEQIATRRLRIIKYRGSEHGENEYPFLITSGGISVLPITSMRLNYTVPNSFISSGLRDLDQMLNNKGFYEGGSILVTGTAGVGKSSVLSAFIAHTCKSGKKCIYFSLEESASQIVRNMKSINIELDKYIKNNMLHILTNFPYSVSLEAHLINMINVIQRIKPAAIVMDPISNLKSIGSPHEVKLMFARLVNHLKMNKITSVFSSLVAEGKSVSTTERVSSIMDVWINLKFVESNGERNRVISIFKSRGMPHSKQMREVILSSNGIRFEKIYVGLGKTLTGSSRIQQEIEENINKIAEKYSLAKRKNDVRGKVKKIRNDILLLQDELKKSSDEIKWLDEEESEMKKTIDVGSASISKYRDVYQRIEKDKTLAKKPLRKRKMRKSHG